MKPSEICFVCLQIWPCHVGLFCLQFIHSNLDITSSPSSSFQGLDLWPVLPSQCPSVSWTSHVSSSFAITLEDDRRNVIHPFLIISSATFPVAGEISRLCKSCYSGVFHRSESFLPINSFRLMLRNCEVILFSRTFDAHNLNGCVVFSPHTHTHTHTHAHTTYREREREREREGEGTCYLRKTPLAIF